MNNKNPDDDQHQKTRLPPEAGKKINMVLSAEARHKAMEEDFFKSRCSKT